MLRVIEKDLKTAEHQDAESEDDSDDDDDFLVIEEAKWREHYSTSTWLNPINLASGRYDVWDICQMPI